MTARRVVAHYLSLTPLRRIVKDYYMVCDSYYQAIRTATPNQIEAIDVGRRALHNEGSELLDRATERQDFHGRRHRASSVHADLRACTGRASNGAAGQPTGRLVRMRPQCRALADGGGAVQASCAGDAPMSARPACARANSIRLPWP